MTNRHAGTASPLEFGFRAQNFGREALCVPYASEDTFAGNAVQRWPHIVFQVFWYPPPGPEPQDTIVLLGEAAAPPVGKLGTHPTSFRLPLDQSLRRAPRNCIAFEEWLAGDFDELQRKEREARASEESQELRWDNEELECNLRSRDQELIALQKALDKANFPAKTIDLLGEFDRAAEGTSQESHQSTLRLCDGSRVTSPAHPVCFAPANAAGLLASSPSAVPRDWSNRSVDGAMTFAGMCHLDVDLAWVHDFAERNMERNRGKLRVDLRSVLVPPCNSGDVRVRVCEVEVPLQTVATVGAPREAGDVPAMDARQALAQRMEELEHRSLPQFPVMHPLWMSEMKGIGKCGKHFAQWNDPVSLQVSQTAQLMQARHFGLLCDAIEPSQRCLDAPGPTNVGFEWKPVQLRAPVPMPRCREHLVASAFFEAPHRSASGHFRSERLH